MTATAIGHNGPPSFRDEHGIPHDIQKMHYFKCDIQALRKAIIDKPLDVRGFYISVLLALYEWMEPLPADDAMAQMRTGIKDIRTYRRMKATLLDLGLIETGPHGHSNSRFEAEISDYVTEFKKRRKAALDREEKARREREKLDIEAQSPPQSTPDYPPQSPPQSRSIEALAKGRLPPPLPGDLSEKHKEINGSDTRIVPELSQNSTTTVVPHARVTRDIVRVKEEEEKLLYPAVAPPKRRSTEARGTRLPDDWFLKESLGNWTLETFVVTHDMIRHEAEAFKNFWLSKSGKAATKLDWDRAWKTWCYNNHRKWKPRPPPLSNGHHIENSLPLADDLAAEWDRARAMLGDGDA